MKTQISVNQWLWQAVKMQQGISIACSRQTRDADQRLSYNAATG